MTMQAKMDFSRTISNAPGDNHNHGECFYFGSMSGCHWDCPVLERGECEIQEEVERILNEKGEV